MAEPGRLQVVATPIGNRGDLSDRARQALASADAIACEDTRISRRLFEEGAKLPPLLAYHEHNEAELAPQLADRIQNGDTIALISDAGTPAISDPGFRLVRECRKRGLPVEPIPGPNAAIAALSASGLPTDQFLFVGFLPPKSAARKRFLVENRDHPATLVCYESTHRLLKFLHEIVDDLGPDRCICVARELTKLHEAIHTGPAAEVLALVSAGSIKGEAVVCIAKDGYEL